MNAPHAGARSFAGLSYDDALARARALVPRLRERAAATEQARTLPPETLADLHACGAIRTLQPARWGGMEFDYVAYVDFPMALARGCASTAWNVANLQIHHWMLAMYDERAQQEVWADDAEALIASGIAFPQGSARRVDGGYLLSGRWSFSSGVNLSAWNMLAATVRDGERVTGHRMCLVPRTQYEVVDDWHVLGMRATGSMTVMAQDVFVPEYRALDVHETRGGDRFPGARVNPNPVYRVPFSAVGGHGIGACAVGNAQAALDHTVELVKARSTNYTGARMRDFQAVQLRVAAAAANIDAARLVLREDCLESQAIANRGAMPDPETKLRYKRNLAFAVSRATEAVDGLHRLAGANGIYQSYPLERLFRDAHALAGHISFNLDTQASAWGYAALGGEVANPLL